MSFRECLVPVCLLLALSNLAFAQSKKPKIKPNINKSKEFANVYHSPSADSTPTVFRSVLQLEIVAKTADEAEASVRYANGVVVSKDGVIVSVVDTPGGSASKTEIESCAILMLDGGAANAKLVKYVPEYGVAVFKASGLNLPALKLTKSSIVAKRRVSWHAILKDGRKTYLYSRPLQVHKSKVKVGNTEDVCEIIDHASSSLNADRSGSALLSLDGTLLGLMGRQKHWNVSPKNIQPRTKVAWAVPAPVLAKIIAE